MSLPEVIHASHPPTDERRAHACWGKEREGRQGENEREGAIEKERRKRENKHAPNRLAIEREGKKEEERERELCPRKNRRK